MKQGTMRWSVQHRCPNMSNHVRSVMSNGDMSIVPCPECYSIVLYSKVIPFTQDIDWQVIDPEDS